MPAQVISFRDVAPRQGEFSLLLANLPGRRQQTIGVLLTDPKTNRVFVRLRRDWEAVATAEDAEVLSALEDDLIAKAQQMGAGELFAFLEESASQSIQITGREAITVQDFDKTLAELYREHVPSEVLRFQTHLPRYSLTVAAGPFLTNELEIEAEEWVEAPADLDLNQNMFVARISGRSMEPMIPDESLCVFRRGVVGSRNGRLVLVRNAQSTGDDQYTVKRYRSEKRVTEDGFAHTRIRLESLNPDYPSWDLDVDEAKYEIVAEFVRVLS